jgi:uncharacterized protein YwqG
MIPETHRGLALPPLHPALEPYRAELQEAAKPAWLLRCHQAQTVSRVQTHIGGTTPFAPVEDGWPSCGRCAEPLGFVWQVDFADSHGIGAFADRGLFQFFYCWGCFAMPSYDEFGWACRWYPDFDAQQMQSAAQLDAPYGSEDAAGRVGPFGVELVPFLSVPGKFSDENPIPRDAQNQMVSEEDGRLWAVYSFTEGFYLEDAMISRVGGYPPWVQFRDETPDCPVCGARAEFVAAIGSDETDLVWGDSGYWYFFACKATPQCHGLAKPLMAFQCY